MTTQAVYRVRDDRGLTWTVFDSERADRLSRAGLRVTARMEGYDDGM